MLTISQVLTTLLVITFVSCQTTYGDKYVSGELEIYYTSDVEPEKAERLATYFKDNGLIQENRHSVQLVRDESGFVLRMILRSGLDRFPGEKMVDLLFLENDLRQRIFDGENFRIEPCDIYFMPVVME